MDIIDFELWSKSLSECKECQNPLKLARKIVGNSFYPVYIPNIFYLYDKDKADEITKNGNELIEILKEKLKI